MKSKRLAVVVAGMFVTAPLGYAATIAQWDFPALATLTTASTVDPNANAGSLLIGPSTQGVTGLAQPTWTNDYYASKPVMTIQRKNDTAADVYFQVTLNANSGFELNMDSWSFDGAAGGGTAGQRTYNVKSSVNNGPGVGFETGPTLASGGFTTIRGASGGTGPMQTITADLSSPAYDHVTSLTMRVYFYSPTVTQNIDVDRLTYNGSVFAVGQTVGTWNVATAGDWITSGNWTGTVPNGVNQEADFFSAITANRTVLVNTPVTVGAIRFNNPTFSYNVAGAASLTMDATISGLIQVQAGTHKINLPLTIAQNTNLDVAAGATLMISNPVTVNAGKTLTPIGAGTVSYESTVTLLNGASALFANSSHVAALTMSPTSNASLTSGSHTTIKVDTLSMDTTSKIDVKDNAIVVTGGDVGTFSAGSYTGISGLVDSGRGAAGQWDGNGIVSSEASAASGLTTVAVMKASDAALADPSHFRGQAINPNDVLVAYTYTGDANLSGKIDADDYFAIDSNVNKTGSTFGFNKGDFNYDGRIDGDDYMLIDASFVGQNGAFSQGSSLSGVSPVPEPASAALVMMGLAGGLFIRRQR